MSKNNINWSYDPAAVPAELLPMLRSLKEFFNINEDAAGEYKLVFERITGEGMISDVSFPTEKSALIKYNTVTTAARGIGSAMAGLAGRQSTSFTMMGIMLDVSRNMVFKLSAVQRLFRRLALLGFNTVLLYSEDTYELPDEPTFGMMRGRYSAGEIRAIDDMGAALGIEVIGCIQTLGHMGQMLRWVDAYYKVKDTASVMMVGNEETHKLIGKMLDFWSANLRTRRIHVGMDETHDLGRGRRLDEKGYTPGFDLFTEHLNVVTAACVERGLKPMIWSDMFFRLGNPRQQYYNLESNIPQRVRDAIPKEVQLVYWDYYNSDQNFYEKFIEMHRELNGEPLMGAGVWIWSRLWYDFERSGKVNRACINGCRSRNLKEIFFTMWGDDGAICHFDSAWTGLTEASDLAFGIDDAEVTSKRYKALTGSDYRINQLPGLMHCLGDIDGVAIPAGHHTDMAAFWDDLLLGLAWRNLEVFNAELPELLTKRFCKLFDDLTPHRDDCGGGNLYYAWLVVRYLRDKMLFRGKLLAAYKAGDKAALKALADNEVPVIAQDLKEVMQEFRKQWLENGKIFGLETMQHRMGGVLTRIYETAERINEYVSGACGALDELEQPLPECAERMCLYQDMASGSIYV